MSCRAKRKVQVEAILMLWNAYWSLNSSEYIVKIAKKYVCLVWLYTRKFQGFAKLQVLDPSGFWVCFFFFFDQRPGNGGRMTKQIKHAKQQRKYYLLLCRWVFPAPGEQHFAAKQVYEASEMTCSWPGSLKACSSPLHGNKKIGKGCKANLHKPPGNKGVPKALAEGVLCGTETTTEMSARRGHECALPR